MKKKNKKKKHHKKKKISSGSDSTSKDWIHGRWHQCAFGTKTSRQLIWVSKEGVFSF